MPALRPLEDYVAEVLGGLSPLPAVDLPLARAHGRVLAEDVTAAVPVPPWTNSSMDGYAVRHAEADGATAESPVVLPVSGDVPAGAAPGALEPGTAMRIMTGAMLPDGADTVIKVEDTDQEPGPHPLPERVELRACPATGVAVRSAGEDVAVGDAVLKAGTVLSAAAVSSAASVGRGTVRVLPRIRVAVVSTGSELVEPGESLPTGSIPDSNSLLLAGLVEEAGAEAVAVLHARDTARSLAEVLAEAAAHADLVLTSGGVSAGAFDPLTMLAADSQAGAGVSLSFSKVAMQPGKPQGHGVIRTADGREVPLIMLPGNPVSVLVSFTVIVAPAIALLAGLDPAAVGRALPVRARAAAGWRTAGPRRQHIPVRFVARPEGLPDGVADGPEDLWVTRWVEPTHHLGSGSHLVASLPAAEALAVVEAGTPSVEAGDEVRLIALSSPAVPGGHLPLTVR